MDDEPALLMVPDETVEVGADPVASMEGEPAILMVPETEEPTP